MIARTLRSTVRRSLRRLARPAFTSFLILSVVSASLPPGLLPAWLPLPAPQPAAAETLPSPRYVSAALMPNGQVGLVFLNVNGSAGETRFLRYTDEHAIADSYQLSSAGPAYPQLAVLNTTLVAAYVDTRSPNVGKLILRTSTDSGASWSAESNPFGSETFDTNTLAPRLVASRSGTTLYLFTAVNNQRPKVRSTTDLASWTTASDAGDTSMRVVTTNNCGNAGQECYRAHAFGFMETATAGTWVYVTQSDAGYTQSGRGTQVGTLGGSWSTQIDHGGSGVLGGGGESTATTFLGRDGAVYYLRAGGEGNYLYLKKSTDGGATWGATTKAYTDGGIAKYLAAAPVGLYVPGYALGEYVWFAGWGGVEDSLRVIPLWTAPQSYARSGTVRLVGSAGSDIDAASAYPYNFGDATRELGGGGYATGALDLALPGRLLPLVFGRSYNSADTGTGPLGPGWTHSYDWTLSENGDLVTIKRGSGARDKFTRNPDGTYQRPLGVSDTLVKNADGSFTLTTREQLKYEFAVPTSNYAPLVLEEDPRAYWRLGESAGSTLADAGPNALSGTLSPSYTLAQPGALSGDANSAVFFAGGYADMGSPSLLNISGTALTIEFWAKGTPGTYDYLVSHTNGSSQGYAVYTGGDAGYHFYVGRAGGLHISGTVPGVWDGAWHHFVNVYDGAQLAVWVDGVQRLVENETAQVTGYTGNFRLAAYNGAGGYSFGGSLDEVALYARALSAAEISDHYQSSLDQSGLLARVHEPAGNQLTLAYTGRRLTRITDTAGRAVTLGYDQAVQLTTLTDPAGRVTRYGYDGEGRLGFVWDRFATASPTPAYPSRVLANTPTAYWRLGEASGTSAADSGPNGITGTYTSVTLGTAGAIAGDANTAISVNGSGYMSAPGSGPLNITGGALTVEAWVKGSAQGASKYIVSKSNSAGSIGYALYTGAAGTLTFLLATSVTGQVLASAPTSPWDNQWHHVAATYDGSRADLYVDGRRVASVPASGTVVASSVVGLRVGQYNGGGLGFVGSLDEVAVYSSALSESDIASRLYGTPSWKYAYDGLTRHISTITDPDGRTVVTNTYDGYGRLATQKDGLNKQTTFTYGAGTVTATDPRSHPTLTTFDSRNRPISVEDQVGANTYTLSYTYDDCGNTSSKTDRRGQRTDYTFDSACKGNLLELKEVQLDPQTPRFTTTWQYDTKNNPTLRTDAKGFTTSSTWDATTNVKLSEARQIDATTSATTKWLYGDANNPGLATGVVAPRGNTTGTPDNTYSTVLAYDSAGNLTSSTDADGNQTTYAYDSLGRRTSMVDPDGNAAGGVPAEHTWTTAYDVLDRVTAETDPLGHATTYGYDGAGHRTSVTDRSGNVTTNTFDGAGRLSTVQQKPDPVGQPTLVYTTSLTRDDNVNATAVTQANGVVTDYGFDALDRLVSMTTHPDGQTSLVTAYTLDGNGNVTSRTTADSVVTSYTYDNLDRLTQVAATGLSTIGYAYDELHRRTQMSDGTGTTTYAYDRMGRLTSATQPNGTTSYTYDLDSNRTTLTYPGPVSVSYVYSNAGRLSSLTDWASRQTSYTHTAAGLAKTVTLPNTMVTTYTYDPAQRLTEITNKIGAATITSHTYTLDNEGNRTGLTEFVSGITTGASDSFGMSYDGLERLTAVTTTNPESFTLDAASNITARTGPSKTFAIDGSNRPTSDGAQSFTWSNADRLTARGTDTFGYDSLDWLTSSTVAGTARTYAYSGDGLLQSRTQGGNTTSLLWDPATAPSRLLVSGSDKIVYGLGPLYSVNGTTVTTFARDGQKSVRAELNGTSVTSSFRYRAYGEISQSQGASTTPAILGYAGQLLDPSGLYYMRARWYDAASARFLSRDALAGDLAQPTTLNVYAYAWASPLKYLDPSGFVATTGNDSEGGACKRVSTCGNPLRPALDAILDERDAAEAARRSSNQLISVTGWLEEVAAVVGAGALVTAAGAYVVAATPTVLVTTGLAKGVPFAGAGTAVALRKATELADRFGGEAANWAHMTTRGDFRVPLTRLSIQIHWFEEVANGIVAGAKWKVQGKLR